MPRPKKLAHTRLAMERVKYGLSGEVSHAANAPRRSLGESLYIDLPSSGEVGLVFPVRV